MSEWQMIVELSLVLFAGFGLMMAAAVLAARLSVDRRGMMARSALTAALTLAWVAFGDVMPNGFYRWRLGDHGLKIAGAMAVSFAIVMLVEWSIRTFAVQRSGSDPSGGG